MLTAIPLVLFAVVCVAQEKPAKTKEMDVAKGQITLQMPADWAKAKNQSPILEFEFTAPADAKKDEPTARVTMMAAGGSIDANIERWYGQFSQPDGKKTKDVSKVEDFEVDGAKVYWIDIPGTFAEKMGGGPFAPGKTTMRESYRMLASIVVLESGLQYFIKMTGPEKLLEEQKEGFMKMLKDLKVKK